jgi:hypothetical protein
MVVKLSQREMIIAAQVGAMRHISSLAKGLRDKHGCKLDAGWQVHIEGACGEMAFAKGIGLYWDAGVDTFKAPDVGLIQVRTRSKDYYELIVRKDDPDEIFVLVTGTAPCYTIRGWMNGKDAKQEKWLKGHGGREEAYFVPQSALSGINSLPRRYLPTQ